MLIQKWLASKGGGGEGKGGEGGEEPAHSPLFLNVNRRSRFHQKHRFQRGFINEEQGLYYIYIYIYIRHRALAARSGVIECTMWAAWRMEECKCLSDPPPLMSLLPAATRRPFFSTYFPIGFYIDFGAILVPKMEPKWSQYYHKIDPKVCPVFG